MLFTFITEVLGLLWIVEIGDPLQGLQGLVIKL